MTRATAAAAAATPSAATPSAATPSAATPSAATPSAATPSAAIDVVYLYVDCTDPAWRSKYEAATQKPLNAVRPCAMGEIYVSLRTLEKYARFQVGRVLVVTDQQRLRDEYLSEWSRARLVHVDHTEIIPREYLPTFSSLTIEAFLDRIPRLTENFLYLNDDMFLGNNVFHKDLVRPDRRPIVYVQPDRDPPRTQSAAFRQQLRQRPWLSWRANVVRLMRAKLGVKVPWRSNHNAIMLSRHAYAETWALFGDELRRVLPHKTRTEEGMNTWLLTVCVGVHRGLVVTVPDSPAVSAAIYCEPKRPHAFAREVQQKVLGLPPARRPKFFCINDLQQVCASAWHQFIARLFQS